MKKILKLIICLTLVFTVAGCGNESTKPIPDINNNGGAEQKEPTAEKSSEEKIKEYVEQNKESVEEVSNDTFDLKFVARGKSVVYSYYYKQTFTSQQVSSMKTALEKSINDSSTVFNNLLSSLRTIVPDTESVIVEYYNGDNTIITSIEFK